MLVLIIFAALSSSPVSSAVMPERPQALTRCRTLVDVSRSAVEARARKLGEMPPAIPIKAVLRTDARGCRTPLTVTAYRSGDHRRRADVAASDW